MQLRYLNFQIYASRTSPLCRNNHRTCAASCSRLERRLILYKSRKRLACEDSQLMSKWWGVKKDQVHIWQNRLTANYHHIPKYLVIRYTRLNLQIIRITNITGHAPSLPLTSYYLSILWKFHFAPLNLEVPEYGRSIVRVEQHRRKVRCQHGISYACAVLMSGKFIKLAVELRRKFMTSFIPSYMEWKYVYSWDWQ